MANARAKESQNYPYVGAHVSVAGGHDKAMRLAAAIGCEVAQVFTKNNMQWFAKPLEQRAIDAYIEAREGNGFNHRVFAHAGYLINLASSNPDSLEKSRESLLRELVRCSRLELPFIVLHPGAHLGAGEEEGVARVGASLDRIFERYDGPAKVALEVTAGQGSCLGARIEHLAGIFAACSQPKRLAVCLDTCHLFAAGFDIRHRAGIDAFVEHFAKRLPWEAVVCVHINDSKGDLGARVDRHELLGKGKIGWECFETLLRHPKFACLPLCLETPNGKNNANDIEQLRKLKEARAAEAR